MSVCVRVCMYFRAQRFVSPAPSLRTANPPPPTAHVLLSTSPRDHPLKMTIKQLQNRLSACRTYSSNLYSVSTHACSADQSNAHRTSPLLTPGLPPPCCFFESLRHGPGLTNPPNRRIVPAQLIRAFPYSFPVPSPNSPPHAPYASLSGTIYKKICSSSSSWTAS